MIDQEIEIQPIPIIVDPEYSRFIVKARLVCKQYGYALAVHGSLVRDLDVIAIPWTTAASNIQPINLATCIEFKTGLSLQNKEPTVKEHGRLAWSFLFPEFGDPRYIDFSVIPIK